MDVWSSRAEVQRERAVRIPGIPPDLGTPTLFIDRIVQRGSYDLLALLAALAP